MTELQIRAVLAGLFYGAWPLLMNRSGLEGSMSAAVLGGVGGLMVLPLAYQNSSVASFAQVSWVFTLLACSSAAIGSISFNGGLAKSAPEDVSTFFVMTITVQILVPAIYQIVLKGEVSLSKLFGFALAGVAAYFLSK